MVHNWSGASYLLKLLGEKSVFGLTAIVNPKASVAGGCHQFWLFIFFIVSFKEKTIFMLMQSDLSILIHDFVFCI
jgi:hypothetical protein